MMKSVLFRGKRDFPPILDAGGNFQYQKLAPVDSSAIVDLLTLMPTSKKQSAPEVIENLGSH